MGYYSLTRNGHLYSLIYDNRCKNALGVIKTRQEIYICVLKYSFKCYRDTHEGIETRQEIDIFILKYSLNVIGIHMKVFKLDKKLASVFTNILVML